MLLSGYFIDTFEILLNICEFCFKIEKEELE